MAVVAVTQEGTDLLLGGEVRSAWVGHYRRGVKAMTLAARSMGLTRAEALKVSASHSPRPVVIWIDPVVTIRVNHEVWATLA